MCESTVYSTDKEVIMEDVMTIEIDKQKIYLTDILGGRKMLEGSIIKVDLDKHSIYIELNPK